MIRQAGYHGRGARLPTTALAALAQRTHRPAEVIAEHRERGHRLVHFPILREAISLAPFARVAVAVGCVLAFQIRGAGRAPVRQLPEDFPSLHLHDAAVLSGLCDGRLRPPPRPYSLPP